MGQYSGTQDEQLMATAEYVVRNPDFFNDAITRWSESFLNGGISNGTFSSLLGRQGLSPIDVGHTEVPLEEIIDHNSGGQSELTTQQLIDLGQSQTELSEALARERDLREQQREDDLNQLEEMNARLSQQLIDVGKSVQDASAAASAQQGGGFLGGLGTGGLIALGLVAVFALRT